MSTDHDLSRLYAAAREATTDQAAVRRVLQRAPARPRRPRGLARVPALAAILVVVLLAAGYGAAAPIRAAVGGVASTFASFWRDDPDVGRPATAEDHLPDWMRDARTARRARVVAEAGGYRLYVVQRHGMLDFDLGNTGVGIGLVPESLDDTDVQLLGPGAQRYADRHGHVPLFGITARRVRTVEIAYGDGSRSTPTRIDGAFVLLVEPDRAPRAVVARNARGTPIQTIRIDPGDGPFRIEWADKIRPRRP